MIKVLADVLMYTVKVIISMSFYTLLENPLQAISKSAAVALLQIFFIECLLLTV